MPSRRRSMVVLLSIICVLSGAGMPHAVAKAKKPTKANTFLRITTVFDSEVFGTIKSAQSGCVDGRTVRLEVEGEEVGEVNADEDGTWAIEAEVADGDELVVRAAQVTFKKGKKKVVCKPASDKETAKLDQPSTRQLTVVVTGTGGRISSSPAGISDCRESSGTCEADFASNTVVQLAAAPDANRSFTGWGGACTGTSQSCTVVMNGDRTVTATFTSAPPPGSGCPNVPTSIPQPLYGILCAIEQML